MQAGIYLRISQDATGEGLGVTRQLEDCEKQAASLGWDVTEVYTDNDISATSGKTRPGYRKMLADIEAKHIDAIVIWSPDRLYRQLRDLEALIPIIELNGIAVSTVKAGDLDLSSAYGRMIARILGAIATGEGEVKSERWKRSWRQGRERGVPAKTGSRMFGYTRGGELIETEAAIARRMAADLLDGDSLLSIARRLEDDGVLTTRGTVWRTGTVRQYLANPKIAGWSTLKGEILSEGQWSPVLDRETWEEVRGLLTSRARPFVPRVSLLNGAIFCGECGHRLITSGAQGKRTYRCPHRPGMPGCGTISGNAVRIEDVVESYTKARILVPEVRRAINELRSIPTTARRDLAEIHARIEELEAQLDEPGVPVATILRAIDRARGKQARLDLELSAVPRVALPARGDEWPEDLQRRRALVDLVVQRVDLTKSTGSGNVFDPTRVQILER